MTTDALLNRYSRHILLPEINNAGQQALTSAHVLLIGLGGLGSPAAMYLASSGIGNLTLADPDRVDLSNLQRQLLHDSHDIGRLKTESARDTLARLNPHCHVATIDGFLHGKALHQAIAEADLVLDASDNFATRFAVNEGCVAANKVLISGAVIRFEGQLSLYHTSAQQPCYRCLYPDDSSGDSGNCSDSGVLAPLAGVIGSLMACEAIQCLTGAGETLLGQLLTINILKNQWKTVDIHKDPACPVCAAGANTSRIGHGA